MNDKLKAFWAKLNSDVGSLWENNKLFLIVFGLLIIVVKFRSVLISLLVANSKAIFDKATKESDSLKKQEDSYNSEADKLVEKAKQPSNDKPVDDDWYKK